VSKKALIVLFVAVAGGILLTPFHLFADDTAYNFDGNGDTVVPVNNNEIEMVNEVVKMRLDHSLNQWFVDAEFVFRNTGPEADVIMGFPDEIVKYNEPGETTKFPITTSSGTYSWTISNFSTVVGDSQVMLEHKELSRQQQSFGVEGDGAYIWKVHFKKRETKTVRNTYTVGLGKREITGYSMFKEFSFKYIVRTGARWKGKIEKASFYIDLYNTPYSPLFKFDPEPQSVEKGVYCLQYENVEPDFDILVNGFYIADWVPEFGMHIDYSIVELSYKLDSPASLRKIDAYTLSIFHNFVYALYGKPFPSRWLREYFAQQTWYKPDPTYSDEMIHNHKLLDIIAKEEASRSK
jgi:hypothetical protein